MAKLLRVWFGEIENDGSFPSKGECWTGDFDVAKNIILAYDGKVPTKKDMEKAYEWADTVSNEKKKAAIEEEKQRKIRIAEERSRISADILKMSMEIEMKDEK